MRRSYPYKGWVGGGGGWDLLGWVFELRLVRK
jgi:hypothetical protein